MRTLFVGETIELKCGDHYKSDRDKNTEWHHNGVVLPRKIKSHHTINQRGKLTLKSVGLEDRGIYKCFPPKVSPAAGINVTYNIEIEGKKIKIVLR